MFIHGNDILDICENTSTPLIYEAWQRKGAVAAVAQHDFRYTSAYDNIGGFQRCGVDAMLDKLSDKDSRLDNPLAGAGRFVGIYRLCGTIHQCNQTFIPAGC